MGKKEEVVVVEGKKEEVITAEYRTHVHCPECARIIEEHFTMQQGVRKVEVHAGSGKVKVVGVKFDAVKVRDTVAKRLRKHVELLTHEKKEVKKEVKKDQEVRIIHVRVPIHCRECETIIKETLLKHKSVHTVEVDRGSHTFRVRGTIKEEEVIKHLRVTIRKHGEVVKVEKVEVKEEEEVKVKEGGGVVEVEKKTKEVEKIKVTEVTAPYFIPCTHPRYVDYSHPEYYDLCRRPYYDDGGYYGGGGCHSYYGDGGRRSYYGDGGYRHYSGDGYYGGYNNYYYHREHAEVENYSSSAFLYCPHRSEYFADENPYACVVM